MTNRAAHRVAAKVRGVAVRAVRGANRRANHNRRKAPISMISSANGANASLAAAAAAARAPAGGARFNGL
jgi:hypothetical protein